MADNKQSTDIEEMARELREKTGSIRQAVARTVEKTRHTKDLVTRAVENAARNRDNTHAVEASEGKVKKNNRESKKTARRPSNAGRADHTAKG